MNGLSVKGLIVTASIPMGKLAQAAGISPSALTHYLTGKLHNASTQRAIWAAYRAMSGRQIPIADFWGKLLSERIAS